MNEKIITLIMKYPYVKIIILKLKKGYKHDIKNPELIVKELKRCADELAACDVSMQTIRNLINAEN